MSRSDTLFKRARKVIPGGVNSPVRAFQAVGGNPVYVESAKGAFMTTVDGDSLLDFCGSWGPLILGHAHPAVVEAVQNAAAKGTSFGTNTQGEVLLAEILCEAIPSMDKVRLVNSGTEATMTALRIARAATGRDRIVKFEGGYHGHSDGLLVSAGSGLLTGGILSSEGVPSQTAETVFIPPYNNLKAVNDIVEAEGQTLAAIIVEPVAGNMGLVPPKEGFLQGLRRLADRCGAMLIFDEVISGFRLGPTSFGVMSGVTPDLTCLGKIIGGGMPIGAVGGKHEAMDLLAPLGPVYQAGTLSGNPVAVAAGLATLNTLREEDPYDRLADLARTLAKGVHEAAAGAGVDMHCATLGGLFTPFFTKLPVQSMAEAKACNTDRHADFFNAMLEQGIYLPPSQFEVGFVSAAHQADHIDRFVAAAHKALAAMASR